MPTPPLAVWALAPVLTLGPALTCIAPRCMAPLFIACAILSVAADCWQRRSRPAFDRHLAILFSAVLAFGALSYLWTINPDDTFSKVKQLAIIFGPLVCLIPVIGRMSADDFRKIGLYAGCGLGFGLFIFLSEMASDFFLYDLFHPGKADVADIKQNKASVLLSLWAYIAFAFFVPRATKNYRMAFTLMVLLVFFAVFGGKSASAQLILAGVPIFVLVLYLLPLRVSLALTLVVTIFLSVSMPFIANSIERHTSWHTTTVINDSIKSRIEIWAQAARRTFEKPVLGWGLNSAPMLPNRDDESYVKGQKIRHLHPHNALAQIWFELGAVGVAALCALFLVFYRRIKKLPDLLVQKYAVFMWATVFLYTLSIWGIWQSWFVATLAFMGAMTYAGVRRMMLEKPV